MQNRLRIVTIISNTIAIVVMLLAILVLIGWWFNITALKTVLPGLASMKFNTALLFLLAAPAIIYSEKQVIVSRILSICIIVLAGLTLSEYIFDVNPGIDQLFVRDTGSSEFPGRMSLATAINFTILGIGLLFSNSKVILSNIMAIVVFLFSMIALVGYLYGADILYTSSIFSTMALHTALSFFALSIALFLANKGSRLIQIATDNTAGSTLLRFLLPMSFVVLLFTTWLFNLGYKANFYSFEFDTVITSVTSIIILVATIYFLALRLHEIDKQRLDAIAQLQLNNEQLEARVIERTQQLEVANADLERSNFRYNEAEKFGRFGHWERDFDADTVTWSQGSREMFGIHGGATPNFETFLSYVHEDDRESLKKGVQDALETHSNFEHEYRIMRLDEEERIIYSSGEYTPTTPGNGRQLRGIMIDITRLKQLEQQTSMYQKAVEESSELIVVFDRDHRYEIANQVYLDYHQLEKDQVIGHHIGEILGEDVYESILRAPLIRSFRGEVQNLEISITYPVLGKRNLLVNYSPLHNSAGNVSHVVAIIRDVTETKLVTIRLRQMVENVNELNQNLESTKARFEGILSTAHDAIISINADEEIIVFNKGAERIFAYSESEIIGQKLSLLIPESARKHHHHHIETFSASTEDNRLMAEDRSILLALRKDGSTFPIEVSLSRSRIPEGEIFTAVIRDISQQKQLEKSIHQANNALERSNKELQQFAYIVSHDMRAPLINLKGFSNMLDKATNNIVEIATGYDSMMTDEDVTTIKQLADERIPVALDFIASSVSRLDQYTGAILELSRVGRREIKAESVDIDAIIAGIIDSLHLSIAEKNITIAPHNIPVFITDRFAIDQILMNVITNAVKYMDKEEGGMIEISAKIAEDTITLTVRDNGRGISESDSDRVFAPFRRAGQNTVEGEGMGLAYVQALVKRLDGDIWFDSQPDEGTSFYIRLPEGEMTK